ncbi:MAG: tRNA (adenosine(37)-N6)-threonylcarbamoyltransferase complex ATPase subunit type 1 TsaE [Candidatus Magasanikbacteria bacterium]|nr:tRNA (adenosine(37)-N6)-threonylcarbamoyltransferase complex ATPase subunit type 1 TsaE [Candidatus Magasanikbacteria bacterium]
MQTKIELKSIEDTEKLANKIASEIFGGQILALEGPVGAGKTTFVKALAKELGITETVVSPTYTLLQPYELPNSVNGVNTLIHIDAYRLESAEDLRAIGVEDFLNDFSALVIIEWPENCAEIFENRKVTFLKFEIIGEKRTATIQ